MSWFIKTVGSPANVKAAIARESYMAQTFKDAVTSICDNTACAPNTQILVESNGHTEPGGVYQGSRLLVEIVAVAQPPTPPPAALPKPEAAPRPEANPNGETAEPVPA